VERIDLEFFECSLPEIQKLEVARSLNEIMNYLEHIEIEHRNALQEMRDFIDDKIKEN